MNKSSNLPLFLFGGLGLYFLLKNVAQTTGEVIKNRIQIGKPKATNFERDGFRGVSFDLTFPLTNNLPLDIPSNTFIGSLFLAGSNIGTVSYPAVSVAAGTSEEITTKVEISIGDLAANIINLFEDPNALFNGIKVAGNFISNGIQVPYESAISFS